MADKGDCLAVFDVDVDALEDGNVWLGRVVELDVFEFDAALVSIDHLLGDLLRIIVASLLLWLNHKAGDLVEGTLHL